MTSPVRRPLGTGTDIPPRPCQACGHLPSAGDPLVTSSAGARVHRSHTLDPADGLYEGGTDRWDGRELGPASVVTTAVIHYRIHDRRTGDLLGHGTVSGDTALGEVLRHSDDVRRAHPGAEIVVRQYDRAARPTE